MFGGEWIHVYPGLSPSALPLKLSQTPLQKGLLWPQALDKHPSGGPRAPCACARLAATRTTRSTYVHLTRCSPVASTAALKERPHLIYLCTSAAAAAKSLQSCPTPCDPIDGSPPGSPVPGILQARTLEWVAISFSNAGK